MIRVFTNHKFKDVHGYLIYNDKRKAILIDTAMGLSKEINDFIKQEDLDLTDILITHGHFDHIVGLDDIYEANGGPTVRIHLKEISSLFDANKNFSALLFNAIDPWFSRPMKNIRIVNPGEELFLNDFKIKVIPEFGHAPGSVMYDFVSIKSLFNGDNLYLEGHSSLLGHSFKIEDNKVMESIIYILENYKKGYSLFPGHWQYGFTVKDVLHKNFKVLKALSAYNEKKNKETSLSQLHKNTNKSALD